MRNLSADHVGPAFSRIVFHVAVADYSKGRARNGGSFGVVRLPRHVRGSRANIACGCVTRVIFVSFPASSGNVGKLGMSHARSRGRFRAGQRVPESVFPRTLQNDTVARNNSRRGLTSSVTAHDGAAVHYGIGQCGRHFEARAFLRCLRRAALRKHQQHVKDYVAPRKPAETKSTVK